MGALCFYLFGVCYFDYKHRRIPNLLVLLILLNGMAGRLGKEGVEGCILFLLEMTVVAALLYPFFRTGAIGAGDVKLFGVCSGYLSYDRILYFLFFSLLLAIVISLFMQWFQRGRKDYLKMRLPLAGPILGSILLCVGGVY